MRQDMLYY